MRRVSNPRNPYQTESVEWLEEPPPAELEVFEEHAKSVLTENDSPDLPFRFSVNPYRGCQHACSYCYARPTHQRLGFGAGTDFERRLVVKVNAPEVLAVELAGRRALGHRIAFSGVTDPYQALEARYSLTRRLLKVCLQRGRGVGVITKGALVARDAQLLSTIHGKFGARVHVSLPFLDRARAREIEPGASSPAKRLEAIRRLADAGVPVGIAFAPWIPGLNDDEIPRVLEAAHEAGARHAWMAPLRLPAEARPVFFERLAESFPGRLKKVESGLRELREGKLSNSTFHARFDGAGPRWQTAKAIFDLTARRLRLDEDSTFQENERDMSRTEEATQGELF